MNPAITIFLNSGAIWGAPVVLEEANHSRTQKIQFSHKAIGSFVFFFALKL
jgi:hypothetical protein